VVDGLRVGSGPLMTLEGKQGPGRVGSNVQEVRCQWSYEPMLVHDAGH
jgi:hypothetical protein